MTELMRVTGHKKRKQDIIKTNQAVCVYTILLITINKQVYKENIAR